MSSAKATKFNPPPSIDKNTTCFKWFKDIVDNKPVDADEGEILDFIINDLKLDMSKFDGILRPALPHMFIVFVRSWSGWQFMSDFKKGRFSIDHYYARFRKYLVYKMQCTLKNTYDSVMKELRRRNPNFPAGTNERPTALELFKRPLGLGPYSTSKAMGFAPYTLQIKCPPHMLNTMVFTNTEDDIIVKQHVGRNWVPLTTTQLIHWPNIRVTFVSQDLFFMRTCDPAYVRYLNFVPQEFSSREENDIVENIEDVGPNSPKLCYTLRYLNAFVDEYVKALKGTNHLKLGRLEEIQTVLYQFLEDIRYFNLQDHTIATNTKILFKMTTVPLIRNKKLVKIFNGSKDIDRVGYCEKIVPRVELTLKHFKAKQTTANPIAFVNTTLLQTKRDSAANETLFPKIFYKCLFCNKDFVTARAKKEILDHLSTEHKMEQPVRCTKCKQQFDVMVLAASRWKHRCEPATEAVSTSK